MYILVSYVKKRALEKYVQMEDRKVYQMLSGCSQVGVF